MTRGTGHVIRNLANSIGHRRGSGKLFSWIARVTPGLKYDARSLPLHRWRSLLTAS